MKSLVGIVVVVAVLAGWLACYPHTAPTPCVNIENCDDPTKLPPVHDRIARDGGPQ